uniref:SPX domain-containing protein n=1 Tax=Chrysotila carterae TaxID=13221 RepID=A0A7S4BFF5_CHRCT|mmetsp:Transcript_13836/g.29147  ORF Transcript_13836/g.29147 Transcript_13836/m.29147 type:complete len:228 (+) Transcript_13836:505-1188(+)
MKFGKQFRGTVQARMPQWAAYMLDYKKLKVAISQLETARSTLQPQGGWSLEEASSSFTALLDEEVDKVNSFYSDRIEEGVIIIHALKQHVDDLEAMLRAKPHDVACLEQRAACQRSLVALHFNLLMLQNYVALNFTGVVKILKKFDKRLVASLRQEYIAAIVELPFYRCAALGQLVEEAEKLFANLERNHCVPSAPQNQQERIVSVSGGTCAPMAVQQPHKSPATAA